MIIVDTNVIAYLLLPGDRTQDAEGAFQRDPDWLAPDLWRSELLNVLCLYVRKKMLAVEEAVAVFEKSASVVGKPAAAPSPRLVMELSLASNCSGYDCEFVALAREMNVKLITTDQKVLTAFPDVAVPLNQFAAGAS